jgi:hypothetical protein
MSYAEDLKIVPLLNSADTGAGVSMDSINMKNYHKATIAITFGAVVGDAVLTVNSGTTDGALTSALTFRYAVGGGAIGAASADVLADWTSAATLTLTAATYTTKMLVLEIDASAMDVANGEEWLTVALSSAGTSAYVHAVAILQPRYSGNQSATALA